MFAYCGNNPVSRVDTTGMFWSKVGQFFNNLWNEVNTWANNTFGAGSAVVHVRDYGTEKMPIIIDQFITVDAGIRSSYTVSETGDSSKPISVYTEVRADNAALSSAGIKLNGPTTSNVYSLGLDNIGHIYTYNTGNSSAFSHGWTCDLSQIKIGYECALISWDGNKQSENYVNISVTGTGICAILFLLTTGQSGLAPQYTS